MKNNSIKHTIEKEGIVSFFVAVFCITIVFQCSGVLFSPKRTILMGDLLELYIPTIKGLCRDILNHRSIYFSWEMGMGMNTSLLNAYYGMSPFNIIYLLFYNADEAILTEFVIIFKVGLAAYFFQKYISEAQDVKGLTSIIFSVLYSLCSYQLAYNIINIIWLDAMIFLPIVFLGIYRLLDNGEKRTLILSYSLIFISQFYMGYLIGIISLMYFVLILLTRRKEPDKRIVFSYLGIVAISMCISAFVWIPALFFVINSGGVESAGFIKPSLGIFDIYYQMFWGRYGILYSDYPNIYAGIAVLIGTPVFFINRKINRSDKLIFGVIILFLSASFLISPLYSFCHAFNYPDGWYYRFSFILSFVLCVISAKTVYYSEGIKKWIWYVVGGSNILILFIYQLMNQNNTNDTLMDKETILFNVLALIIWPVILAYFHELTSRGRMWKAIVMILIITEMTYEGISVYGCLGGNSVELHNLWNTTGKELSDNLNNTDEFYRVNSKYDMCVNSGALWGYNGISSFWSVENNKLGDTLKKLGVYSHKKMIVNAGITPITKMLLGVKYDMYNGISDVMNSYGTEAEDWRGRIEENSEILELGFLVNGSVGDYTIDDENVFENNNSVLSTMISDRVDVFTRIPYDKFYFVEDGMKLKIEEDKVIFEDEDNYADGSVMLYAETVKDDNEAYAYFRSKKPIQIDDRKNLNFVGNDKSIEFLFSGDWTYYNPYMVELKDNDDRQNQLMIKLGNNTDKIEFDEILVYEYDENELRKAYNYLSDSQLQVDAFEDGYVHGNIKVTDERRVLFTSIPYIKGWKAKVNGKEVEIEPILNDTFISVLMPDEGTYEIEFIYNAPGRRAGVTISVLSVICVFAYAALRWHLKRNSIKRAIA